jgi:hypothetical protein
MPFCFECKSFVPGLIEVCPGCGTSYPKYSSPVTGIWEYENFTLQQHKDILKTFPLFLRKINPARVLEIGTGHGGFSLFLRNSLNEMGLAETPIKSFDVIERECYDALRSRGVEVSVQNLFDSSYSKIEERELIETYIQSPGVSLVLCDGGNKRMEFNILSPLLKEGDFVMAHDYAPDLQYFDKHIKGKRWDWFQIEDSHIEEACRTNNLVSFEEIDFTDLVWVCKYKKASERSEP